QCERPDTTPSRTLTSPSRSTMFWKGRSGFSLRIGAFTASKGIFKEFQRTKLTGRGIAPMRMPRLLKHTRRRASADEAARALLGSLMTAKLRWSAGQAKTSMFPTTRVPPRKSWGCEVYRLSPNLVKAVMVEDTACRAPTSAHGKGSQDGTGAFRLFS